MTCCPQCLQLRSCCWIHIFSTVPLWHWTNLEFVNNVLYWKPYWKLNNVLYICIIQQFMWVSHSEMLKNTVYFLAPCAASACPEAMSIPIRLSFYYLVVTPVAQSSLFSSICLTRKAESFCVSWHHAGLMLVVLAELLCRDAIPSSMPVTGGAPLVLFAHRRFQKNNAASQDFFCMFWVFSASLDAYFMAFCAVLATVRHCPSTSTDGCHPTVSLIQSWT